MKRCVGEMQILKRETLAYIGKMVAAQTATTHVPAAIGGAISSSNGTTSSTSENPAKQGRNDFSTAATIPKDQVKQNVHLQR